MRDNWLSAVPNRFSLTTPPDFFLDLLTAYDSELVIFPSQEDGVYRLARRTRNARAGVGYQLLKDRPDTHVYSLYRLVPVTSILPSPLVQWGPVILNDLAERDIQRVGGPAAAAQLLEDYEDRKQQQLDRTIADDADDLAAFTWKALKWRTGSTVDLGGRQPEGARSRTHASKPRRTYRPVGGSTAFVRDSPARNRAAYVADDVVVAR